MIFSLESAVSCIRRGNCSKLTLILEFHPHFHCIACKPSERSIRSKACKPTERFHEVKYVNGYKKFPAGKNIIQYNILFSNTTNLPTIQYGYLNERNK